MRVIECDECGETISADNDDELAKRLGDHLEREHGSQPGDEELARLVADEGYEAVDS